MYKYRFIGKKKGKSEKAKFFSCLRCLFSSDYNVGQNFF